MTRPHPETFASLTAYATGRRREQAARDAVAAAYEPVETEGITRLSWGWCVAIWYAVTLPLWLVVIACIRWVLAWI